MEKELIKAWFEKPNYRIGVEIYKRLGSNNFLKILFDSGESSYNMNRLKEELKHLESSLKAVSKPIFIEKKLNETNNYKRIISDDTPASERDDAPDEIKAAIEQRKNLYAEARFLKSTLVSEEDKEVRKKACLRIISIFKQINPLWELTQYYDKPPHKLPPTFNKIESSLEDETSIVLNAKWINHYKYLKKFISDSSKKEKLLQRYLEAKQIETILIERDAYQHSKLIIPVPD